MTRPGPALFTVATAAVALAAGVLLHAQAQTPQQSWSQFLGAGDDGGSLAPNRIKIEYEKPTNPDLDLVYALATQRRGLEKVQEIFSPVKLPMDVTVRAKQCGMSNAWYQRPVLTICYEYAQDIFKMVPKEIGPDGITPHDATLGQFLYTASHEMGHAVFDLLDVPLFGRPEDAADEFAAHVLLRIGKDEARKLILGAAYTYKDYIKNPTVTVPVTAFADVHGAPMQRLYNLICMAYGADKDTFGDLVGGGYLPKERAPNCRVEYGELNFAFEKLIYPNLDKQLLDQVLSKSWVPMEHPRRRTDLPQTLR